MKNGVCLQRGGEIFSWIFKRLEKTKAAWTDDNQKNNRTEVKYSPLRKAFMFVLLTRFKPSKIYKTMPICSQSFYSVT
jgi:hypothetical protein